MAMSKKFAKMRNDKRAEMGVGTMIIFIAMVLVAAVAASVLISTANNVREQATQTGSDAITNVASGFDIKYVKGTVSGNEITSIDIFLQLHAGSPALKLGDVIISMTAGGKSGEITYVDKATASVQATDKFGSKIYTYNSGDNECVEIDGKFYPVGTDPGKTLPSDLDDIDPAPVPKMITMPNAAPGVNDEPAMYSATLVPPQATGAFEDYGTVSQGDLVKITIEYINGDALAIEPGDKVNIKIMPARGSATTVSFTVPPVLYTGTVNLR